MINLRLPRFQAKPKSLGNCRHDEEALSNGDIEGKKSKTYNNRHSLVVTDPTTTRSVHGLTLRELTGTRIFRVLWSYVPKLAKL